MAATKDVYVPISCSRDNLKGECVDIYDFSVHGGAIGTIELPTEIPDNAVIVEVFIDVLEALASGGSATVALGLNTTTDVLAATAFGSVTGIVAGIPNTTPVKLTAERNLQVTIATAALTAGKFAVYTRWIGPFDEIEPR